MLTRLFRQTAVPVEYRSNFLHLYMDIGWFGVLSGSAINFLNIYATRIGASGLQIGLIAAMPAVIGLFLALPSARWLQRRRIDKAIFWTSVYYRIGFLIFVFLPRLFDAPVQIWAIIIITFLMAIPVTPLGVGFNALFAEAVPNEYRGHVAGIRNVLLSIAFVGSSLISGYILEHTPFELGYQIVFGIGFIGAAMSSVHLFFVRPVEILPPVVHGSASPEIPASAAPQPRPDPIRRLARSLGTLRLDIWRTRFRNVLFGLFGYYLAQHLALPVFPLYNVRVLELNDNHIGIGTALFYMTVLFGSTRLSRVVHRFGHKNVTGVGVAGMALYPFLLALSTEVWQFYVISLLGGFIWALAGGAVANYMLEHIPPGDRPSHLAWHTIILNAAILLGSLAGPLIAEVAGLAGALLLFSLIRLFAGLAILKWG